MHSDNPGARPGFRYVPDPLGRLGQGRYVRERELPDPFGRLPAEPGPEPEIEDLRDPLHLRDSVGLEGANGRRDVAKVESLLGRTGDLDLADTDGVTGFAGLRLDEAVRRFQKRHGLKVDGHVAPGGETVTTLGATLAAEQESDSDTDDGSDQPPDRKLPLIPEKPGETRDRMDSIPTVPGTLDDNEILKEEIDEIFRILKKRRERSA